MKTIEFASIDTPPQKAQTSPWTTPKPRTFEDRILKPEFAARRFRFRDGWNWFRIVPAIAPAAQDQWMLGVHAIKWKGGQVAHPKSVVPGARSAFDQAYTWVKQHHPKSLYSKANATGVRLLTDPLALTWVITEEDGRSAVQLLQLSGYDGSRGGNPGLGWQLFHAARETDEKGNIIADAINPAAGVLVGIEKNHPKGARFPSYYIKLGRNPSPINDHLANLDPAERDALCPLKETVELLSEHQQWKYLEHFIAPQTVEKIRSDVSKAANETPMGAEAIQELE